MKAMAPLILKVRVNQRGISKILHFFSSMENIIFTQTGSETVIKGNVTRNVVAAAYTLAVTYAVGKWGIYMAYLERGYESIGGEYCLILMVCWLAWKAINYLFDTLEDMEHERNRKKTLHICAKALQQPTILYQFQLYKSSKNYNMEVKIYE